MIIPRWLISLLHVYVGTVPLLIPFFCSKLNLVQPFSNSTYLTMSVFGLVCISYVINFGVPSTEDTRSGRKVLAKLRLISLVPQLILFLILIGTLAPEQNLIDYALLIFGYCFSVASVIWRTGIAKYAYMNDELNTARPFVEGKDVARIVWKSLFYVSFSAAITWGFGMLFSFDKNLPNYATVFSVVLGFLMWFGDNLKKEANKPLKRDAAKDRRTP